MSLSKFGGCPVNGWGELFCNKGQQMLQVWHARLLFYDENGARVESDLSFNALLFCVNSSPINR